MLHKDLSKIAVLTIVGLWLLLLLITHHSANSPYSYVQAIFDIWGPRLNGAVVNPDMTMVYPVTRFFYDVTPVHFPKAHGFHLPLYSFLAATLAAYTRSYLIASYGINLVMALLLTWASISVADRFGIRRWPMLIALLTFFSLPLFVVYIGQPAYYIAGPAISFLVVLAFAALGDDARRPVIAGLLTAVLTLNYDYFVVAAAVVLYLFLFVRFRRWFHYPAYLAVAAAPVVCWAWWVRMISHGEQSTQLRDDFYLVVLNEWAVRFRDWQDQVMVPYVTSHIGVHMGLHMIVAMIYWPLLAFLMIVLWKYRPAIRSVPANWLLVLLVLCFFAVQFVTGPFDWENNPRRAIPVLFAFGWAYCWAVDKVFDDRRWRSVVLALFAMSAVFAYSDTFFRSPSVTFTSTGQAIRYSPRVAVEVEKRLLRTEDMPKLMKDHDIRWHDLPSARVPRGAWMVFLQAQLIPGGLLLFLFWILGKTRLLPARAGLAFGLFWLFSAVRFL